MSRDSVLGRKNGKKDCYYEWTIGFRQIKVGKCFMEIKGLDDLFQEYFDKGKKPDEIVGIEMINDTRKQNFIPEDVEDLYDEALLNEYKFYFDARKEDHKSNGGGAPRSRADGACEAPPHDDGDRQLIRTPK